MRLTVVALLACLLCGCGDSDTAVRQPVPFADARISADGIARWSRTCAMCHVDGEGGAPRMGDKVAWAERLVQGEETLLLHTIEGLNNMPPLGYCMDCEREDFRAFIRFMTDGAPTS